MKNKNYISFFKSLTAFAGLLIVIILLAIWIKEATHKEYVIIQKEYDELLQLPENQDDIVIFQRGIRELHPEGLNRLDRCISCHTAMDTEVDNSGKIPFSAHPGPYLTDHDPNEFGCTICHGGQGLATTSREAHARERGVKWPFPLLDQPYIQSACGQCHLTIYSEMVSLEGTEFFKQGHDLFVGEGCLGCHKARGVGGNLGPDLTEQGEKTRYEYNFHNIEGEQSVSNWLKEHFRDPEMVSPGSRMLSFDLPEADLDALATFTMGLYNPDIHYSYFSKLTLDELSGHRRNIDQLIMYPMLCSGCHGERGEGKDYEDYITGVPGIGKRTFLSTAYDDLIRFTLLHGRGDRQMASWMPTHSGLRDSEIEDIVEYLGDLRDRPRDSIPTKSGQDLYTHNCIFCHGPNGSGDAAKAINNKSLLGSASDEILSGLIRSGRMESGMPSHHYLSAQNITNLVQYIRRWGPYQHKRLAALPKGNAEDGSIPFHYRCSRCHGEFGQGNTGPAIINKSFLSVVPDDFLYKTISSGRDHTAMFGWETAMVGSDRPDKQELADIIAFMREADAIGTEYIFQGPLKGNPTQGETLYVTHCIECHGKNGEGTKAPALNNQEFLNAATNGFLLSTISLGRNSTKMPAWAKNDNKQTVLTAQERHDIISHIRQWQKINIKK